MELPGYDRSVVERMKLGCALNRIIRDGTGKPIDFEVLDVNPAYERITGRRRDLVVGRRISGIAPALLEDEFDWLGVYGEVAAGQGEREFERRAPWLGRTFRVHVFSPEPGLFVTLFEDETGRREAEDRRELYHAAMEELEQAVVFTDLKGRIVDVNRAFLKLYGYSREEALGSTPRILNPGKEVYLDLGYSAEDYDEIFRGLWAALRDPERGTWRGNIVNKRKDGSLVWASLVVNAVRDASGRATNYVGLPFDISESVRSERAGKFELYSTIASLADLRDNETGNHMKRVGIFAKLLAKSVGMPRKYCDDIELFAPMHDIGKVGILDSLLLAERKLTPSEFEEMKKHTVLGHDIVKGKKELEMVAAIALRHHERWDGLGYPDGIAGEDIPLSARITSLADIYDALRSERPYKRAWSHEEAAREVLSYAGNRLDPVLVERFEALAPSFEKIYAALA